MKTMAKFAIGAAMACGLAVAAAAPAEAGVSIGIGVGVPYRYAAPCYGPYGYNNPNYCGYRAYYGPAYVGGYWHDRDRGDRDRFDHGSYGRGYNGRGWGDRGHRGGDGD